jgi:hypothetical protein
MCYKADTNPEDKMSDAENRNHQNQAKEALASLAEIQQVLDSTHVIEFPWQVLIAYGALILAMPLFETSTAYLTFGNSELMGNQWALALRHVLFYGVLFGGLRFLLLNFTDAWNGLKPAHPLIRSAAQIQSIIVATALVAIVILGRADRMDLWIPILFPLTGILFFIFGTFSKGPMKVTAWFQVALGLVYGLLLKDYSSDVLWKPFTLIYGATFIGSGAVLYVRRVKTTDGR